VKGTRQCRVNALALSCCVIAGCGSPPTATQGPTAPASSEVFRSVDCNAVTDEDLTSVVGPGLFARVVVNDAGCFWQENSVLDGFGIGMGISTWSYRGSDLDTERSLEQNAGRTLTEVTVNGNKGFKAYDDNACSVYVTKGNDVITWSVQSVNPGVLPDLCSITEQLAQLSQNRVN
jgi:hypothetical protein